MSERYKGTLNDIYLSLFGILIFYYVYSYSSFSIKIPHGIVAIICIAFSMIKVIFDHHSFLGKISVILLFVLGIISVFTTKHLIMLTDISMIMAAKDVNYRQIIRIFFYTGLFTTIPIIFLSLIGLIPNLTYARGAGIRQCLGFSYPNYLSEMIFVLSISFCIFHYKKISWTRIGILLILSYIELAIPNTKMDFYCMLLLTLVVALEKIVPKILYKFPFSFAWLSLLIMSFLSFYYAFGYSNGSNSSYDINTLLENRINYSNIALNKDGISLFGHKIYENADKMSVGANINSITQANYFYIDQSIIRMAVVYGMIILLLFLIFYSYKMFKLRSLRLNYLVLLFTVVVIRGFSDVNLLTIIGDPFLVILLSNIHEFIPVKLKNNKYGKRLN